MASLLQGIEKSGLLTSTSKMTSVIGDVARNMTTDKGLDQSRMLTIAQGMRGLASKAVQFIEVPTETYAANQNWVQWTPESAQLFSAIAHDTKLPAKPKAKAGATTANAKAVVARKLTPASIKVEVENGSGINLAGSNGATALAGRGFDVIGHQDADNFAYTASVIEYHSRADLAAAQVVKRQFSDVEILQKADVPAGTVRAILGSSFTSLATAVPAASTANLTQTFGGITGSTRICKDNTAFEGPNGE
jgi:hypothetical protein